MKSEVILLAFGVFFVSLAGHIVVWRIRHPRRHALALFVFFSIPASLMIWAISRVLDSLSGTDLFAIALMYTAVSSAYIQLYPASQAQSPSMKLLSMVQKSMPHGMTEDEIRVSFDSAQIFQARVDDLLHAGLLRREDGFIALTGKGRAFIWPFIFYRRLLGIPEGKG